MQIVVIGGQGFVGSNVMVELQSRGYRPVTLSRKSGCDLRDYLDTKNSLRGLKPDVIINCAAHVGSLHYVTQFAADIVHDNMQMIVNLYRAVSEVCPEVVVINPIANCSYPGEADIYRESAWWDGPVHESVLAYGNTRRLLYVFSRCYHMQYHIKTVNFLVPNCFGPGDSVDPNKTHALNGIIIRMLKAKRAGYGEFEIWGTGKPAREWVYVKDLARMLGDAVNIEGDLLYPVNIAQNKAYSIKETAEMIKELIDYRGEIIFNTNYQDGAPVKVMDDRFFRERFPDFRFTDIREAIKETIAYYRAALDE